MRAAVRTNLAGIGFVVAGIAWQGWWLGRAASLLSVALVASYLVWLQGSWAVTPRLRLAACIAILVFALHALEESLTGLPRALPALFGRPSWDIDRFVTFNAAWGMVFVVATITAKPGRRLPLLALLFLAVAGGIGNGIAHLLMVAVRGNYFPGAWTALPSLLAGLWLLGAMRTPVSEPGHPSRV